MSTGVSRRSVLLGGGAAAAGVAALGAPVRAGTPDRALWKIAREKGLRFGSAQSTRLFDDAAYVRLVDRQAEILFTEDDLLWYQLKPTPDSDLDFSSGDRFMAHARAQCKQIFGAHLVWDEGFGDGWTEDDLWGMDAATARHLILSTIRRVVGRYRGQVAAWSVVNEAVDAATGDGLRTDVPWYATIGPSYVAESFRAAHAADPHALLVLNEFGFETDDEWDTAADKRSAALRVLDSLLEKDVPVHALGVQAHLTAGGFAAKFDPKSYRRFLSDVADRGLQILVTELDVLDDGLPADVAARDRGVADTYRRYLDVALQEPAVSTVMCFELSNQYSWLNEDYPRDDGAERRPLPFDDDLQPTPAYRAIRDALASARRRAAVP